MKKLNLFFICAAIVATMCCCSQSESSDKAKSATNNTTEVATAPDTTQVEQAPAEPAESATFTTAKGTFKIEEALSSMYDLGTQRGSTAKGWNEEVDSKGLPSSAKNSKSKAKSEAKRTFKHLWLSEYGKPDNDEAKKVYDQALQKFNEGFDDGWEF